MMSGKNACRSRRLNGLHLRSCTKFSVKTTNMCLNGGQADRHGDGGLTISASFGQVYQDCFLLLGEDDTYSRTVPASVNSRCGFMTWGLATSDIEQGPSK